MWDFVTYKYSFPSIINSTWDFSYKTVRWKDLFGNPERRDAVTVRKQSLNRSLSLFFQGVCMSKVHPN